MTKELFLHGSVLTALQQIPRPSHTHVHLHTSSHVHIHGCAHAHTDTYMHVHTHMCPRMHRPARAKICSHLHTCTHTCVSMHVCACTQDMCTCVYVHSHTCMHVCTCICTCVLTCAHICSHLRTHIPAPQWWLTCLHLTPGAGSSMPEDASCSLCLMPATPTLPPKPRKSSRSTGPPKDFGPTPSPQGCCSSRAVPQGQTLMVRTGLRVL